MCFPLPRSYVVVSAVFFSTFPSLGCCTVFSSVLFFSSAPAANPISGISVTTRHRTSSHAVSLYLIFVLSFVPLIEYIYILLLFSPFKQYRYHRLIQHKFILYFLIRYLCVYYITYFLTLHAILKINHAKNSHLRKCFSFSCFKSITIFCRSYYQRP